MKTIDELTTEFKPYYPKFILKALGIAEYNKKFNIFGLEISTRSVVITIYVLITILMIISYEMNDNQMTTVAWSIFLLWVIFMLCNLLFMCLVWYNNFRIKLICKKNGYSLKDWNDSIKYKNNSKIEKL